MEHRMLADCLNLIAFFRLTIPTDRHLCTFAQLAVAPCGSTQIYIIVVRYAYHYSERGLEGESICDFFYLDSHNNV
jgi:hypothetical protein